MIATIIVLAVGAVQRDWYTYEPEGKSFRIELPSKPNATSSRTVNSAAGKSQVTTVQLKTSDAEYTILLTESGSKIDPKTLDDGIRQFAAANMAVLGGAVKPITVGGSPGREFEFTAPSPEGQKRTKMRWIASGNTLFILAVDSNPGGKVTADAARFFGSLEIGGARASRGASVKADDTGGGKSPVKGTETVEDEPKATAMPKDSARKPAAATKLTISRIPKNAKSYADEDLQDLPRSFTANERDGFRDVGPAGSVLVGVRVSYVDRFGGSMIGAAQPIYRSGKNHYQGRVYGQVVGPVMTVVAKPGYAVGGIVTRTGLLVNGFGIVFMKVDGDHLDAADTYNSPWMGDRKGGGTGEVSSNGGLVVGLQGRSRKEVNALGLTSLK